MVTGGLFTDKVISSEMWLHGPSFVLNSESFPGSSVYSVQVESESENELALPSVRFVVSFSDKGIVSDKG